jgi:hypothetical protein
VLEVTEEAADQFLAEANGYLADLDHAGTPVLH